MRCWLIDCLLLLPSLYRLYLAAALVDEASGARFFVPRCVSGRFPDLPVRLMASHVDAGVPRTAISTHSLWWPGDQLLGDLGDISLTLVSSRRSATVHEPQSTQSANVPKLTNSHSPIKLNSVRITHKIK